MLCTKERSHRHWCHVTSPHPIWAGQWTDPADFELGWEWDGVWMWCVRCRRTDDGERLHSLDLVGHLTCHRWAVAVGRWVEAGELCGQVSHGSHHTFPWPRRSPDSTAATPHSAASATDDPLPHLRRWTSDAYIIILVFCSQSVNSWHYSTVLGRVSLLQLECLYGSFLSALKTYRASSQQCMGGATKYTWSKVWPWILIGVWAYYIWNFAAILVNKY